MPGKLSVGPASVQGQAVRQASPASVQGQAVRQVGQARLQGQAVCQADPARLQGQAVRQADQARLQGQAVRQAGPVRLQGQAVRQGCQARLQGQAVCQAGRELGITGLVLTQPTLGFLNTSAPARDCLSLFSSIYRCSLMFTDVRTEHRPSYFQCCRLGHG